jgi:acetylornithine deacetylase
MGNRWFLFMYLIIIGGYLTQFGTPAIVFGPGETSMAHQKDEYIEIEKIYQCAEILALTLIKWCKV